ncbi:MAG TPA: hypothetical protein VFX15_03775 [Actinomycetes bacterium]|nr:hypothetical protein [Actinomycetes bacterium]
MNGNDDFFGGSVTPPAPNPGQAPGASNPHLAVNKEYANYGHVGLPPKQSSSNALPLVIGAVVLALVGVLAFAGYRMMFAGSQIEIPDTMLGLEKMDASSPAAQQLQSELEKATSQFGGDVDVEVGLFQGDRTMLFVMGGEAGTDDVSGGAEDYFAGFEGGLAQAGSSLKLTEVNAGPHGGQMKCLELPTGGTCAWISDDTFGAFAMSPMQGTAAETALKVRDAIEK